MELLIKSGEIKGVGHKSLDVRCLENKQADYLSSQSGFTLIELMIVMALIGILAAIAQPQFQQYTIRAREAVLRENLFTLREVIDQYYGDKGKYPESLQDLVSNRYIRKVPADPFTKSSDTWVTVAPDAGEGVVFDVHSGSDLISLDGTPYNEW